MRKSKLERVTVKSIKPKFRVNNIIIIKQTLAQDNIRPINVTNALRAVEQSQKQILVCFEFAPETGQRQ